MDERCDWCDRNKINPGEDVITAVGHSDTRFCSWECHDLWCIQDKEIRDEFLAQREASE